MAGWALAIDFGTSNTAAAHTSALTGRIETLPLTHQSNLLPSGVYADSTKQILTGTAALAAADRDPTRFLPSPKRLIGQVPAVLLDGDDYPLEHLIAPVLATVYQRAVTAHNGTPPHQVVLTHPEAWSQQQITTLIAAATHAGIDPAAVQLVSEPRAAAHQYSRATDTAPGTTIAVFDFGGGTLDVAVLAVTEEGRFEVLAARGDNSLGGKTFDARLRRWIEEHLGDGDPAIAAAVAAAPPHLQRSIDEQIRAAKEHLSEAPSATVTLDTGTGRHTATITRGEFDEVIGPDLDRAIALARATLTDAGITGPEDLTAVYLTGGSARIPLVHTRVGELGPVATLDDPKTVVAHGALLTVETIPTPGGLDTVPLRRRPATAPQAPAAATATAAAAAITAAGVSGRRWSTTTAAAVVVGLVVVAGVAVAVVRGLDGDSAATAGAAPSAPAGSGGAVARDSADPRHATDRLPEPLAGQVRNCTATRFEEGNLEVACDLEATSPLTAGRVSAGPASSTVSVTVSAIGNTAAMQRILSMRSYDDPAGVRENDTGTAALSMSTFADMFTVANADLGVQVHVHGQSDVEGAEAFARALGLFG
ncbi:Hsp70 family protein [Rhodococcus sp. RDE2]|uniref:Hsp70 family protein n=1 Tax=Rhodococcus sp. RDE2 TaxID=2885078 RepID=UPI001E44DF56|nr:Hsp70 family protein [Rhodococcus sp. RDE2]